DQAAADTDLANALLAAMDTDGDGVVTKAEMTKALAALRRVPKDSKGKMTVEKTANANAAGPGAGPEAGQGNPGIGAAAGPGGGRGNEALARFMQYDRNRDGRLTPDEVPPQARAMLQGADLNGDGAIEPAELQLFSARM